ncbi:adenylate/guanylate cyclase domain-containing protein [Shimia abyssi]|uniref:Adenylate cyclase n=1 Tax=Shimia abyssi TaxID=1662395 RepID=A0A2P8FE47_9RHOB|nr:adenylate/guanylate cyclase domain-containing protein [Shimia abyssi]PSL19996.1 adenylate cyclase [Shimia abyssi]
MSLDQGTQAARVPDVSFDGAEQLGLMLAARVRIVALTVVVIWVAIDNPNHGWSYLFQLSQVVVFVLIGVLQFYSAKLGWFSDRAKYGFVAIDCALLAVISSAQNPLASYVLPPAIMMASSQFMFFYLFLMQAAFSFRPSLVLWCGASIVLARTGMLAWFASRPDAFTNLDLPEQSVDAFVAARADPDFIYLGFWAQEILITVLLSAGLAALVRRSRRLVTSQVEAERSRASLARYFSPNVVERISQRNSDLGVAREQDVAVLFVDIVGFTALCEQYSASEVVALLRGYHDRLGRAVFENGGTLDKYLGDGLMATFGTPDTHPDDARRALQCAFDMCALLEQWNVEREADGQTEVKIGIGIHFGPVVVGDIGNARRLEFGVIGDTVNVASRLEQLTRAFGRPIAVSDAVVDAIAADDKTGQILLRRLEDRGDQAVRGRREQVGVWVTRDQANAA